MAARWQGLTIVELLVAISIAGVLLAAALPAVHGLVRASRLDAATRELHGHIQLARTAAVHFRQVVTLCPLEGRGGTTGTRCGSDWTHGYMVFVDADADAVRDQPGDTQLAEVPESSAVNIRWRAFRRRDALQFRADGATHLSNGTFTLCPADNAATTEGSGDGTSTTTGVVRLVINVGGRTRTDRRGDPVALCD